MPTDDPNLIDPVNLFLYYLSVGYPPKVAHEKSQRAPGVRLMWPTNVRMSVQPEFVDNDHVINYTFESINGEVAIQPIEEKDRG
jgi:hypothetical protein